jgi:hypothetical protein
MSESSQRLRHRVVASLRHTDPPLNLGKCALHRRARQIKLQSKFCKGRIGRLGTKASNSRMQAL